jgi:hypothetical protein
LAWEIEKGRRVDGAMSQLQADSGLLILLSVSRNLVLASQRRRHSR